MTLQILCPMYPSSVLIEYILELSTETVTGGGIVQENMVFKCETMSTDGNRCMFI